MCEMCGKDQTSLNSDPQAVERAREIAQAYGTTGSVAPGIAVGGISAATPPPHILVPSREEVRAQDLSISSLPHIYGLEAFIADLTDKSPTAALEILERRFREDSSPSNAALLQAGINRITTLTSPSEADRVFAQRAMDLFHEQSSEPSADDIWYQGWVDADFQGASVFDDLVPGWVYWRRPDFRSIGLNDKLSSLIYGIARGEAGGNVVLFENIDYNGRYQNYTGSPGNDYQVSYVGGNFNDITSSSLIIRRFSNETSPVSIGTLVPAGDITKIVSQQHGVSPNGNATFTWDLWPTGPLSNSDWHPNDPGKRFIYVIVPLRVHTPWPYPDVNAQARYWIYLYVDSSGQLQGYVDWYGYYTDSCCFLFSCITGQVGNQLLQGVGGTVGQVNNLVATALSLANTGAPYRLSYFLPGSNQFSGNTSDDVTIVAVR